MKKFIKQFNQPSRYLEYIGYAIVSIGLILCLVGIFGFFKSLGEPSGAINGVVVVILSALIFLFVLPQYFFGFSKIVKVC